MKLVLVKSYLPRKAGSASPQREAAKHKDTVSMLVTIKRNEVKSLTSHLKVDGNIIDWEKEKENYLTEKYGL